MVLDPQSLKNPLPRSRGSESRRRSRDRKGAGSWVLVLACVLTLQAESPRFSRGDFHGRDAYFLENAFMRVAALRGAGHIGELRLKGENPKFSINPMRVAHYKTIEPWAYDPAEHDSVYGGGANRILMSGYMGHLMNFPTFGGPSDAESKNNLGNHGEALSREWKLDRTEVDGSAAMLWYSAHLPKTQYNVGRVLTLPADETVLYIEEWVESLTDYDRPAMWVQHVTFGSPFVEPGKTVLDMSGTKGAVRRGNDATNSLSSGPIQWPNGTDFQGKLTSLREMQTRASAGTYAGVLMDPKRELSYFTMYNTDYNVLVGYIWKKRDFPWVGDWQENGRNKQLPWGGKVKARGIEFGTTPFGGTMESVVSEGEIFATPTYRWIPGRQLLDTLYVAFLMPILDGFQGVDDVQVGNAKITVTERSSGKTFSIKSEHQW